MLSEDDFALAWDVPDQPLHEHSDSLPLPLESWPKQESWSLEIESVSADHNTEHRQGMAITTSTESNSMTAILPTQPCSSTQTSNVSPFRQTDTDLSAVRDLFLSALDPAPLQSEPKPAFIDPMLVPQKLQRTSMSPIVKHHFTKQAQQQQHNNNNNMGRVGGAGCIGGMPFGPMTMTMGSGEQGNNNDMLLRSIGSPSSLSDTSFALHNNFSVAPQNALSATHTNGLIFTSADVSLNSSFRHDEMELRSTPRERRLNAAATYTNGMLDPSQPLLDRLGCISVVDPQRRKLQLPASIIRHTKALGSRLTTPSLCLLYQAGRCRQGANCYQIHADPETVAALRAKAERQLCCCSIHGDANSNMWNVLAHSHRSISVGRSVIPLTHVAFTAGLQRILNDERLTVPVNPSLLCRLQEQPTSCRYGADCKFLHICREILNTTSGKGGEPNPALLSVPVPPHQHTVGAAGGHPVAGGNNANMLHTNADFSSSISSQMLGSEHSGCTSSNPSALPAPTSIGPAGMFFPAQAQPQYVLRQINSDGSVTLVPVSVIAEAMPPHTV